MQLNEGNETDQTPELSRFCTSSPSPGVSSLEREALEGELGIFKEALAEEFEHQRSLERQLREAEDGLLKCRELQEEKLAKEQEKWRTLLSTAERNYEEELTDLENRLQNALANLSMERDIGLQKTLTLQSKLTEIQDEMCSKAKRHEEELEMWRTMLGTSETMHEGTKEKLKDAEKKLRAAESALQRERDKKEAAERKLRDIQAHRYSAGHAACWQYEMNGQWYPFSPEGNDQMHQAYLTYIGDMLEGRWAHIFAGGVERVVDFAEMKQTNLRTRQTRSIRVVTGVPLQWESAPETLLTQSDDLRDMYVEVKDASVVEAVQDILRTSGHAWDMSTECSRMKSATVKSVHRIENYQLWQRYRARLSTMREDHAKYHVCVEPVALDLDGFCGVMTESQAVLDCGEPLARDVDEKILLHGTSWSNADAIVLHGFDHRTCARGMYGDGVYFADAACKSNQYACALDCRQGPACTCERTVIIARVALGDAYCTIQTRLGERTPPSRPGNNGMHDSVVVYPGNITPFLFAPVHHQVHQEFVIFDREQAFPSFVVQYLL